MYRDKKRTITDLIVIIALFISGLFAGKIVMERIANTWIAFNAPAVGILCFGELVWWRVSKKIFKD